MGDDPKHLALFVTGLGVGGAQSTMLMLARAFAERGHRVDLVAARSSGPMREHIPPAVRLVALDSESLRWHNLLSHKGIRAIAAAPAMAAYLRRERQRA